MRTSYLTLCPAALGLLLAAAGAAAEDPVHEHHQATGHEAHPEHAQHDPGQAGGAADPHAAHRAQMAKPAEAAQAADLKFKDLPLLDQDGRQVRLVSDVIGDRIVVMDFVYTTCTTVCPVLTALLSQVQERLGDRLGTEVLLVSMTVDPTRDTPERLKAYAEDRGAGPGWLWLTGAKPTVESVLDGLGAYSPRFEDHAAMVLVGDGRSGQWSRFFGFPSTDRILEQVDALLAARQADHEHGAGG
jgi:protein SCO1/2